MNVYKRPGRTCNSLMGAGLHGLNGLNPEVSRKIGCPISVQECYMSYMDSK